MTIDATYRGEGNTVLWTANLSGSATAAKGDLVHTGNNYFCLVVDELEDGEEGPVIVNGYIEASVIFNDTGTVGQRPVNNATTIQTVTTLKAVTAGTTATSNLIFLQDVVASTAAQTILMKLVG